MNNKIILIITVVLLTSSCSNQPAQADATAAAPENETMVTLTDAQVKNAGIQLGKPWLGNMNTVLKVNGLVDVPPQNMVSVSFPLGGYLKSTQLLPGMKVTKGQTIAVMEDQALIQLQQDYLVAKSKVYFLEKEYERQKLLNENKTTSDKVLEQVSSDYEVQQVVLNSLKEKLLMIGLNPAALNAGKISRTINIHAPINGYVASVKVNIGKYVNPSEILFELVNPEDLHLALKVFEKDLHRIKIGQKIKAHLVNDTNKIYDAEVILISQNLDADRSAMVHCHFENNTHNLLPGMFLNADITLEEASSVLVPEDAVVRYGEKQYIFIERGNNHFEMKEVQTGNTSNGVTAVVTDLAGINSNRIVVKNAYSVLMKIKNKEE